VSVHKTARDNTISNAIQSNLLTSSINESKLNTAKSLLLYIKQDFFPFVATNQGTRETFEDPKNHSLSVSNEAN